LTIPPPPRTTLFPYTTLFRSREVKLGCVFTQTLTDEEGHPLRDHQSTTYVGSFEPAEAFGLKIRTEAQRRGIGSARIVVFLGDRSEEHTSELQSRSDLVCRLL